ncbi:MAG: hypothetical protein FWH22_02345, partial [Fibromonadales bacterium]|nr:hypothetical protein [Fibromonadales bacterium]
MRISLEKANSDFNNELQQQVDGSLPKGHIYRLGYPGEILREAGLLDLPIELSAERIAVKASQNYRRKHPFDLLDIKDLPNAINDPIAIFNSTKPNDNSKMILTELKHDGNNFIVAIKTYTDKHNRKVEVNVNTIR